MLSRSRKARRRASKLASVAGPKASGGESPAASFFCLISSPMRAKPALRTELLFYLSFLTAAALLLGVATMLFVTSFAPEGTFALVMLMVALEVGVFVVFGRHLVSRLVLWPLERVVATADAVADGDLERRAPDAETRDFSTLAERINRMTDHLVDAQGQLVRSEKLASIGRLAAGIAHEVGNPLGAIGTYVEVLRRRGADGEVVAGLTRELDRIDQIVRGLLDYARPQEEPLAPLDPVAVLRGAHALLEAQGALKAVRADLEIAAGVPHILGRAYLLEQVIVNLVLNAVDAASGGLVVLGARPWAYEPGRAAPKRATDAGRTAFPRGYERRPARVEFAAGRQGPCCSSPTPVRASPRKIATRSSSRSTRPRSPGAAPGSASPSSHAPCTTWAASCGWTLPAKAGPRSKCSFRRRLTFPLSATRRGGQGVRYESRPRGRRRARAAPIPRPAVG